MNTYTVTDNTGKTITRGDIITDFRGQSHLFFSVTRGTEYNGTAKISTGVDAYGREYYANVFNLTVVTRITWYADNNKFSGISLTPEDIAELDPYNIGIFILFGVKYRKPVN